MALYDAASGLIVSWLLIYPSNEPPEACSGEHYSMVTVHFVFEANCVHLYASLCLCSHWITVTDNLGEKPYCSSSNHAFSWHSNQLPFDPLGIWWVQSRWLYWSLVRPSWDLGCSLLQVMRSNTGWPICQGQGWLHLCAFLIIAVLTLKYGCEKHSHKEVHME